MRQLVVVPLLVCLLSASCSSDPQATYCDAVEEHQAALTPADLDDAGRQAIETAARAVGSQQTVAAMAAVEQHALDVCGTPLSR